MLTLEQKRQVWAVCGYEPYEQQLRAHASEARVKLVAGGERAGKSRWTAAEIVPLLVPNPLDLVTQETVKRVRIAIAAQSYDESRVEFEYLIEDLEALGLLREKAIPKVGKWVLHTHAGGRVSSVSLKDGGRELTGRGLPFDMVAIVEAGRVPAKTYLDARLRVTERRGNVLLTGTIWEEHGWYAELFELLSGPNDLQGQSYSIPSWENRKVYPGGIDDPEIVAIRAQMTESEFWRRLGAKILPGPARIYPMFNVREYVVDTPYDPGLPVHLAIDSGFFPSKYSVLAIQPRLSDLADHGDDETEEEHFEQADMREVLFVLDEIWEQGWVHQQVIAECQKRYWWDNVVRVWLGHEGTQHAASESTEEVWRREAGLPVTVCNRPVRKYHGFMRMQTFLSDPVTGKSRIHVDKSCKGLIHEYTHYERRKNRFGDVVSEDPPKDAEDDALDAFTNYLVDRHGLVDKRIVQGRRGRRRLAIRG